MSTGRKIFVAAALFASAHVLAATPEHGSEAEAQEMVQKAVALIKSAGPEAAYKAFTDHPGGAFKDRDLYIFVYDFEGNNIAHGANPKMVGKNLLELKDVDGKELIKDQIKLVKANGAGWYGPYRFTNPVTNKIESKKSYCMRGAGDTYACAGAYLGQ
jgi:signal transduction histidine kinase